MESALRRMADGPFCIGSQFVGLTTGNLKNRQGDL
jgi:hypothetical protein